MKKQSISILLLVPMLLTSCGSNNSDPVSLPNKGTEITVEDGKAKFKQSYDALAASEDTSSSDAIELAISGGSFSLDFEAANSTAGVTGQSFNGGFHLSDLNASVAVKGLTSTNASDIKGYMSVSFTLDYNLTLNLGGVAGSSTNTTYKKDKADYSLEAYFDNSGVYFDFSNANVLELVKTCLTLTGNSTTIANLNNGKLCYKASGFDENALPILSSSSANAEAYASIESAILSSEGTFKSHGNDTYSYSYSIDATKLKSEVDEAIKNLDVNSEGGLNFSAVVTLLKAVTIDASSSFEYAVIFNTNKGITSVGAKETIKASIGTNTTGTTASASSSASLKVSLNTGSSAKIKEVSDKSSFKAVNVD